MRFSFLSTLVVALAADSAVASTWFGKAAYNKWHQTELERWLDDHNVPYPQPADRKDLENLVKSNWNSKVATPYQEWDTPRLQSYLSAKGYQAKAGAEDNTQSLIDTMKQYWYETEDKAAEAYHSVQDWIFDSWTDSQLKAFCDRHGIPVPQPRTRDSLLQTVRSNYQSAANKVGETAAYPGNWLYESWSDSDLKAWLDERGYPAPQPSTRDSLIASVRRNARLAHLQMKGSLDSATSSAASAQESLTDALLDAWSDTQIKAWADKNGIKVPQGSKRNELIALARKHRAQLTGDTAASSASSYYGAATSNVGNQYAQATATAASGFWGYYDWIKAQVGLGSQSASASLSSASVRASNSASSASSLAAKSASSASVQASKSASSVSKSASKAGKQSTDAAASSASSASSKLSKAAKSASSAGRDEL
ncbi:hypothetical protein M501DRAFT_963447 [Patellaria atrata CBS 101060]|uniref:Stress response protein ish1 n=1 Tax=Patellaria atrata CBS 101060 TaxID=1346257 RepID=A0A9P4S4N0_9PEZI|nr:hypothetical protein M501DRAFT_963447 [Patellaria atrata CBS 101060]